MSKSPVALFALFLVSLCPASAQTGSNAGIATGDVWPSREQHIYVPREALELPNPPQPGDLEIATGDVWHSRNNTFTSERAIPSVVDEEVPFLHLPMR
jgi:hypothetical protein